MQFANLVAHYANVAELAHAGRDRVCQLVGGNDLVNHGPRPIHPFARVRRQKHRAPLGCNFAHSFQSKIVAANVKCVQVIFLSCFPTAARNTFIYLSGISAIFIAASVTMCVVSPSARSAASSARRNS